MLTILLLQFCLDQSELEALLNQINDGRGVGNIPLGLRGSNGTEICKILAINIMPRFIE